MQSTAYKKLVKVSGLIFVNFFIYCNLDTVGFNGQKLKIVPGRLQIQHIKCNYKTKELKFLHSIKSAIVSEIEEAFQQKMLKWREDGSPAVEKTNING